MNAHSSSPLSDAAQAFSLLDGLLDPFFAVDAQWHYTYVNHHAAAIMGVTPAELLGRVLWECFPEALDTALDGAYRRVMQTRKVEEFDLLYPALQVWVEVRAFPYADGIAVHFRDITARKLDAQRREGLLAVTQALSAATDRRSVVEAALAAGLPALGAFAGTVLTVTQDGEALEVLHQGGYDDLRARTWARFPMTTPFPATDAVREKAPVFVREREMVARYPALHAAKAEQTRAVAALPLQVHGRVFGAMTLSFDTDRTWNAPEREFAAALAGQLAQALERARLAEVEGQGRAALEREQARLAAVLDGLAPVVWHSRADGTVERFNQRWHDLTGLSPQPEGQEWLAAIHPEDRKVADTARGRGLATGDAYTVELRLRTRDGAYRWHLVQVAPLREVPRQAPHGWVGSATDIHDRREAEEASGRAQENLARSEERFRALIEATDQYVWTNSPEGEMVGEQPGWARLTGQHQDEYQGYGWSQRLHPEDREQAVSAWHESVRNRSLYEVEQRVRVADGGYRSFLVRAVPLLGEDGRVHEWVGLHSDITDLKRAELMLKAWGSELERQVATRTEELRAESAALAAFADFTEEVGGEAEQRDLARRACEVLHQAFEDGTAVYYEPDGELWRGVAYAGHLPEETLALVRRGLPAETVGIAQSVTARDAMFIDGWREEQDDTARQTQEYGTAAFFPVMVGGEVVGLLTAGLLSRAQWAPREQAVVRGVGRGLTLAAERAAAVRALREQQEVVEARNQALEGFAVLARDLAFEPDPLVLVGRAQGIVLDLLPEGFGLYYRPEGELWRLRVQTGSLRSDELQAAVDAGLPLEETHNLWLPFQTGEPHYQDSYDTGTDGLGDLASNVGATACLPVHADGAVAGVLAVCLFGVHRWSRVDRALLETAVLMLELAFERSQVARQLAEQQAQLRAANEELGAFAYTVSHDLRAPVRHVGSFAGLLRKKIGDNPALLRYVDQIEGAATRMETLTDALLGLARAGATPLTLADVDLGALVEAVRTDLALDHAGRHVTWRIGHLPTVRGDAGLLRQVLANLLGNAVKYSRERETAVVEVWAEERPSEVIVAVRDNGAGFDPQYAGKLFGVFQRLHHQDEFEGTGIGLANVRRIVEKHGGRVWASARPGEGATFFFSLPRA